MRKEFANLFKEARKNRSDLTLLLGDISVGLFQEDVPDRSSELIDGVFNLGILEQSMISIAAGMAAGGRLPIVHTISPFIIERALEQIKLDLTYNLNKVILVSANGPFEYKKLGVTHHCSNDVPLLSLYNDINIYCPYSVPDMSDCFYKALHSDNSSYLRLSNLDAVSLEVPSSLSLVAANQTDLSILEVFVGEASRLAGKTPFLRSSCKFVSDVSGFDLSLLEGFSKVVFYEPYSAPILGIRYLRRVGDVSGVELLSYPKRLDGVFDGFELVHHR